jgi:hypothetical protein
MSKKCDTCASWTPRPNDPEYGDCKSTVNLVRAIRVTRKALNDAGVPHSIEISLGPAGTYAEDGDSCPAWIVR